MLLPVHSAALSDGALAIWLLAAALLLVVTAATLLHWLRYPATARSHHRTLSMAPFYGAPPMALMTVGSGALLAGRPLLGATAMRIDGVLWALGTAGGLLCATAIPYLLFTRLRPSWTDINGGWLMAVVPPMVSAAAGAGLVAHLPAGQDRLYLLLGCYALFGISLLMALIIITLLWARLAIHGIGESRLVPTYWIVLGPLGQSITAAGLLGHAAPHAISGPYASGLRVMGVLYGVPIWGFALAWAAIALAITIRTARHHLPFSLTWWSFTFPIGTVVTGTAELAQSVHAPGLTDIAIGGYVILVAAWITVAARTAHGTWRGTLLQPPITPTPTNTPQVSEIPGVEAATA
jgi:tellurite resistance protein TehA-like permease